VYLPFLIAIPAYLIIDMVCLVIAVGWALAWITIQCCELAGQAIAQRRARTRQAIPVVSSDHPPGPPRIEHTDMTDQTSPRWQPPPPQPPRKSWPARHKAWSAIISVGGVLVVLAVIGAVAGSKYASNQIERWVPVAAGA